MLVATVYDADGKPSRHRRVEWTLDGPGTIIEADEPGLLTAWKTKTEEKSAVRYTDAFEHRLARGAKSPPEGVAVRPGQTWVVVRSATPGETTVTVSAPEVADRDKGRVVVKLVWADSPYTFPPPAVSRPGGEIDLNTTLNRTGPDPADGLKVRYRVIDGAPAVLVAKVGAGTTAALSGGGQKEVEVSADADGKAAVRVTQPTPKAGTTKIAVEVLKPDATVVGRKETTVEWSAAELTLDAEAPKAAAVGREAAFTLTVANAGKADSGPVTVKAALPAGADFVRSDPPPTAQDDRQLTWTVGGVTAGQKRAITLTVRPTRTGSIAVPASAETADGLRAEHRATVTADRAGLKLTATAPAQAGVGDRLTVQVAVTNTGAVPVENATAWVGFDPGLAHESDANPAEVNVGTVPPGQTKTVEVPLTAKQTGKATVRINVAADGGLTDRAETAVDVHKTGLKLSLTGPESLTLGKEDAWELRVTNTGDVAVPDAVARLTLPKALVAKSASDGGKLTGTDGAEWKLGALAPGETKAVRLTAAADQTTPRGVVSATVQGGGPGAGVQSSTEAAVAVAGQPALALELADVPGPVPAGQRASVRITVRNRGTGPAKKVEVSATATAPLTVVGGTGADRKPGQLDGQKVTFGVIDELPAGSAAVFVIDLEAAKPGPARVQAEVRADHLAQPIREEQAARVVNGGN